MQLFTLIITTCVFLIRPGELHPSLAPIPIYEICIVSCILVSYHTMMAQFKSQALASAPLTLTFLAYYASLILSHVANLQFQEAFDTLFEFAKVIPYYFLVVGILDRKERLITFLKWFGLAGCVTTIVAFLALWKYISIIGQENIITGFGDNAIERMGSTGLFKDPNDFESILSIFILIAIYFATRKGTAFVFRIFWLSAIALFFQAHRETSSRGGLLALGGGLVAWAYGRFGRKGLLIIPVLASSLLVMGGRQGDLSLSSGTGQERIQIQHAGLTSFLHRPIFGVGFNHYAIDISSHVAHNSFLQAFAELGFFGGAIFMSAYIIALIMLMKLGDHPYKIVDPQMSELRAMMLGVITSEMMAKMSLTHNSVITTFMIWAWVAAFGRICVTNPAVDRWLRISLGVFYSIVGIGGVIFFYVYLNVMVRFG